MKFCQRRINLLT